MVVLVVVVIRVDVLADAVSAGNPLLGLLSIRDLQGSIRLFLFVVVTREGKSVAEGVVVGPGGFPSVPNELFLVGKYA